MSNNKKTVLAVCNVAVRLLAICLIVAALTALVYTVTKDTIANGERQRKEDAIRAIFPDAVSFDEWENATLENGCNAIYFVKEQNGGIIGHCVDYTGTSDYGGDVNMMIGVSPVGKVVGLRIISHSETFIDRYTDETGCYTGIDAAENSDLSAGATMSYRAIRNAMRAVEAMPVPYVTVPEGGAPLAPDDPADELDESQKEEMEKIFTNGVSFLRQDAVSSNHVQDVFAVKNSTDQTIGYCVFYVTDQGYRGEIKLLMACDNQGRVTAVKIIKGYDEHIGFYTDSANFYDRDLAAGATSQTCRAIENAIAAVESLALGGAV